MQTPRFEVYPRGIAPKPRSAELPVPYPFKYRTLPKALDSSAKLPIFTVTSSAYP